MVKIFFTFKPSKSNYGGGAFFVENLIKYLKNLNYKITYNLENDIDIIFITDPRKGKNKKYSIDDIINYKKNFPNIKIIHRVNENDIKREKSINIEPLLVKTMYIANKVVFVSEWLEKYFIKKYKLKINSTSILNGCNSEYYFPIRDKKLNKKIRIVTHHWSDNYLKGFHIYNEIDKYLEKHKNFEFIFIGNYNKSYKPRNIRLMKPTHSLELGNLLRECDIYLTATQNEPGGMHYLEGASCGLPILFCKGGGGTTEICSKFGLEFKDLKDMLNKLNIIKENYDDYRKKIDYEYLSSDRCSNEYINIINDL